MKWYKKIFFRLLDVTLYNAYVLYKYEKSSDIQLSAFRLMLIKEISTKFAQKTKRPGQPGQPALTSHKRQVDCHYISSILGKKKQRKCHVCSNTTRRPKKRKD